MLESQYIEKSVAKSFTQICSENECSSVFSHIKEESHIFFVLVSNSFHRERSLESEM